MKLMLKMLQGTLKASLLGSQNLQFTTKFMKRKIILYLDSFSNNIISMNYAVQIGDTEANVCLQSSVFESLMILFHFIVFIEIGFCRNSV